MEKINNKKSNVLSILGIIFCIIAVLCGAICLFEVIDMLISNNGWQALGVVIILIVVGGSGLVASLLSLILNAIAYKKDKTKFKLITIIASIVSVCLVVSSFLTLFIGANI